MVPPEQPRRKKARLNPAVYAQPGTIALMTTCTASRRPLFSNTRLADLVLAEVRRLHGENWRVLGYCVMPDHVHIMVLNANGSVIDFMRLLKGRTAKVLRNRTEGPVWQRGFHDHLLRRNEDITGTLKYLVENAVRVGLVREWTDYRWCGSLEWPGLSPEFFSLNPSDVMWAEIFSQSEEIDRP